MAPAAWTAASRRRASLLFGVLAVGCSHAWDALEPTGSTGSGGGAGGDAPSSSASEASASGAGGSMIALQTTVKASVAACIDTFLPDPAECENSAGPGQMVVSNTGKFPIDPYVSFIRFDLDSALAGKTIDAVMLKLVVTSAAGAESDHTGEVWSVSSFSQASLSSGGPSQIGNAPIAPDQGAVTKGQVVQWPLPKALVVASTSVFLGIYPLSDDNVNYWNTMGAQPPVLVVKYH